MVKVDIDLSGVKIPKQVAGVKVPKKLRKKGKKLLAKAQDLTASPEGREAIAAGLTMAGAAIAAGMKAKAAKRARAAEASAEAGQSGEAAAPPHPPVPPRAPGAPGIDPNKDLGEALAAGIGALQTFLAGRKPG